MNKLLPVLILILGFQAKAGVVLEPFIGYDQGTKKSVDLSATEDSSKNSGTDYGARIGYRFGQGVWVAAEYAGGSGKSKNDNTAVADSDYTKSVMSAVVGYDVNRFRVWAGYGFSDKMTIKQTGSADADITGTNLKVGVGFRAASSVSVNFEYLMPKYTKMTVSGTDYTISDYYTKFDTSGMMLSVSFPFDLSK